MAEYMGKSEQQKRRAYSPAVITQGGKTVWLAGQTATVDEQGKDIAGNFEAVSSDVSAAGNLDDLIASMARLQN